MVCNKHALLMARLEPVAYEGTENIGSFLGWKASSGAPVAVGRLW